MVLEYRSLIRILIQQILYDMNRDEKKKSFDMMFMSRCCRDEERKNDQRLINTKDYGKRSTYMISEKNWLFDFFRRWFDWYVSWRSSHWLDCCTIRLVSHVYLHDFAECLWRIGIIPSCSLSTRNQTRIGIIVFDTGANYFIVLTNIRLSFFLPFYSFFFLFCISNHLFIGYYIDKIFISRECANFRFDGLYTKDNSSTHS